MRSVLLVLSIALIGSSFCAHAKMYKWVDENGQMHFSDKVPVEYMLKAHDELNEHGIVTKHKAAAKTEAEKAEDKRLAWEQKQLELAEKKKKQRDRVLLDTYTTERDLIVARDARLDAVDSQIQLAETIISDSNKNIESLEKQVAQIKASSREVPADIYGRLNKEKQQVKVQSQVKDKHKDRRDIISKQFQEYIERFKVLKAEQKSNRERLTKERGF
jgi:methionine-rich copper-binding protein CopC